MAVGADKVSVRHRKCWGTLFKGLLILLILFSVAVNHGSTLVFSTMLGGDRGAKAAAEAGNKVIGMAKMFPTVSWIICARSWSRYGE